jgi:KDO2-lipid IV(A) lauroyltransferase
LNPALIRFGSRVAARLPRSVALGIARVLAVGWCLADGRARRQIVRNLQRVHGRSYRGLRLWRAVYRTFASYACYWAESLALPRVDHATLDAGMRIDGWEHIADGLAAGRGVILALPHMGGWEWAGFWLAAVMRVPTSVVVERLEPAELFDWFFDLRRALGMNVIPLGPGAGADVVRALKANHVVCLLCDRDLDGGGVEVEFLGERTTLPAGPATLAVRTGAPLLPTAVYFEPPGHVGRVRPPLPIERSGRLRDDVGRVTQALARELEELIRIAPDQWHLLQPNWPSDRAALAARAARDARDAPDPGASTVTG